jgi:hypothetical protein
MLKMLINEVGFEHLMSFPLLLRPLPHQQPRTSNPDPGIRGSEFHDSQEPLN